MARNYNIRLKEQKLLESRQDKWIRGLNTLVSNTQIRNDELSVGTDITLVEDGKVQCPRDGQSYYGNTDGSRVTGLFTFYKSDGTEELLRSVGTALKKYNASTSNWDTISGNTYTTGLNTNGVMAYDRLYLCNGTDALTYYDGTSITTFTERSAPTGLSVTRGGGSTGTYTYSYKVTAVTAVGETTPSAADTIDMSVDELDVTNYASLSWNAVTGAVGYNVYGNKDGAWYFMKYVEGNLSLSYDDKGTDVANEFFSTPEGNSTAGQKGKYISMYKDSLFIAGDPDNPSRLYYSGGGDNIHNFTIEAGGGLIDISKNDGQTITGLIVFKNSLLVFKEESIYQFSFTTSGLPQVEQVSDAIGAIAPRSIIAVENDIFFASRRGIFTIGNEAGFAFDVLRTNELSAKIRSVYQQVDQGYIQNMAAFYATGNKINVVIFSYTPSGSTTNSKSIVYDRERLAWYQWTNIQANCWSEWRDSDGTIHFLYGDDSSGYVKEILSGDDDFGTNINGTFRLKAQDFKKIETYKRIKDISIVLREPHGAVQMSLIVDGSTTAFTTNAATISPSINFGHYVFAQFLFGDSYGTGAVTASDDIVVRTKRNVQTEGKTFALEFTNGSSGASFVLLSASMTAKPRSDRFRLSTDLIS